MKRCYICDKKFREKQRTEKYCSGKCSESWQKESANKRYKKHGLVKSKCICCYGKGYVFQNYENTQKEQIDKVVLLYKNGFGIREIQRELKIKSPFTVTYYLRKANQKVSPKLKLKK